MCFDSKSSLLAWSISFSVSWFLFERNRDYDRWMAGFILIFSSIQLLEGGIWKVMEGSENHSQEIIDLLTRLIFIALLMQPLIQTYLGYKFTGSKILMVSSLIFFGIILWAFYQIYNSIPGQFTTNVGERGHLQWINKMTPNSFLGWTSFLYLLGIFIPLLFMKNYKGIPIVIVGILTALYSLMYSGPKEFSSYWCITAVFVSLTAVCI